MRVHVCKLGNGRRRGIWLMHVFLLKWIAAACDDDDDDGRRVCSRIRI